MKEIVSYRIIDTKTNKPVGSDYTVANRNRARARADRMSNDYGSYRYKAVPVFSN